MYPPPPPQPEEVVEPELLIPCPRPVRYRTGTRVARFLLFNLLIVGLVWGQWRIDRELSDLRRLMAAGRIARGSVTGKHTVQGKHTTYFLDFQFQPDGGADAVNDSERVSEERYDATSGGEALPVTYLPGAPETHRAGIVNQTVLSDTSSDDWTIFGVCGATGATMLGALEWYVRDRRKLLRDGVAVVGQVVDRKVVRAKNTYYKVTYRYTAPFDELVYRDANVPKAVFDRLKDGDPLTVLYHESRPRWGVPYVAITQAEVYEPDLL